LYFDGDDLTAQFGGNANLIGLDRAGSGEGSALGAGFEFVHKQLFE